ncbi:MAG: EthD family reductase [Comamonadaceae bacterium]|nr:MAG: EthD family reductase [Comamonadaceae bacterium]
MHRLLVTYPRPADPQRFLDYYTSRHVPLARTLPGLLACRYMQPQALGPGEAAHFLVFEADFESEAAMFAALGSPTGAQVAADVPNYSPGGATLMHYDVPPG